MENQESTQLSLFDFNSEEVDQVKREQEFQKNDLTHNGTDNKESEGNLLTEALHINTSNIFEFKKMEINPLKLTSSEENNKRLTEFKNSCQMNV